MDSRRELYTALQAKKRIIVVWEADRNKGGASLADLRQEATEYCDEAVEGYPGYRGAAEVLQMVFGDTTSPPIVWVNQLHSSRSHAA